MVVLKHYVKGTPWQLNLKMKRTAVHMRSFSLMLFLRYLLCQFYKDFMEQNEHMLPYFVFNVVCLLLHHSVNLHHTTSLKECVLQEPSKLIMNMTAISHKGNSSLRKCIIMNMLWETKQNYVGEISKALRFKQGRGNKGFKSFLEFW